MGSTRLPGKSMMLLGNKTIVGGILERVKKCKAIDKIVLAIPDTKENDILTLEARNEGICCFRGSESDCLDRYYQAAKYYGADIVGRLPADNPVPDPVEIDRVAQHHRSLGRNGFSTNLAEIMGSGYPDGLGAEMFDFELLHDAWEKNKDPEKREHVHLNFFNYKTGLAVEPEKCPVSFPECPAYLRNLGLVLDINTKEDYLKFREMFQHYQNLGIHNVSTDHVIRWFESKP
jgi:spore coat polysaccharide biosynthesis protein SpsF